MLADGTMFEGEAIGAEPPGGVASGEVVFNTVLSGYQEVLSDPCYAGQIITFTYPHIGNYGTNADRRREPPARSAAGVVVRDLARRRSNWRADDDLDDYLRRHGVAGIAGIDTRRLTRHIRDAGAMPGAFGTADEARPQAGGRRRARHRRRRPRRHRHHRRAVHRRRRPPPGRRLRLRHQDDDPAPPRRGSPPSRSCRRRRRPPTCSPASPTACSSRTAPATRPRSRTPPTPSASLLGEVPVFGICLGHQLLGTAIGGTHREAAVRPPRRQPPGAPPRHRQGRDHQPEPQLRRRRRLASAASPRSPTSTSTTASARASGCRDAPAFSVQHHPEAGPGPHDSAYLFDLFDGADGRGRSMPKRTDIESILLIGSGPIVIGQACEFDYSGTQACRVLREEGYRVILANSNPATIMTDPEFADATYVEPLDADVLTAIIEREQPDAVLPTLGGQTALNLAMELVERGAVAAARARPSSSAPTPRPSPPPRTASSSRWRCRRSASSVPVGGTAHTMDEAREVVARVGLPGRHPARLHPRRQGHRHRHHARGVRAHGRQRPRRQPDLRDPHRAVDRRVEGVRARGHARPGRQLRDHLLDREPRPDGRAHRRLDHRGAGPDADRRRVPADARRRLRLHPPGRRRDRRLATCSSPSTRPTATWSSSR